MWIKSSITIPAVAAISFCLIGGTTPAAAYADLGDQLFKLLPNDGATFDSFGFSVAISGLTAIVGATFDDDNGPSSGSAYLFDVATGRQLTKLLPTDGATSDLFGASVAIYGNTAIVGARGNGDFGDLSGSAYIFDATTGIQIAKLLPNDGAAGDEFGISVAISSDTAIVGARGDDDSGDSSGSTYLFDISDPANPMQIAKLLPDDGAAFDLFGASVAISGNIAIVGAYRDDDNGSGSGSAYLFDTTTGQQLLKLLPNDGAVNDLFGYSVAISGDTALVSARQDDDNGGQSGSAYLFDAITGQQITKFSADDGESGDNFGISVAIRGTTAIVGANYDEDNGDESGSAYLFDVSDPKNPVQMAKLLPGDGAAGDEFGWSVAISGATAIGGARRDDDNGTDSGAAYLFDAAAPGNCLWDLDANGSVGAADLLDLLFNWGPCLGCAADFDGDDIVGASDLLAMLFNWGPCP